MSARVASRSDRISRVVAALGCVTRARGMRLGGAPADHYHNAACMLDRARPAMVQHGQRAAVAVAFAALDMATVHGLPTQTYESLCLDIVEALAGDLPTFDGLTASRKAHVLTYALTILGAHAGEAHQWGPRTLPDGEEAWALVDECRAIVRSYAA